jgi:hypothetical protein
MDEGPDEEGPRSWSDVSLFAVEVDVGRGSNDVDIGTQEEEVADEVYDFEEETILPG